MTEIPRKLVGVSAARKIPYMLFASDEQWLCRVFLVTFDTSLSN